MNLFDDLSEKLVRKGIKPSIQRVKILEYLLACSDHPTADQIFHDLRPGVHSLSKATVYNTLALFAEKGLLKVLALQDNENRYDITTFGHGHFICSSCRNVYDFDIDIDHFTTDKLHDFKITDKDVYFKGICPGCRAKQRQGQKGE